MDRFFPGWILNRKTYKTVSGLCKAIAKDCGASQIGGVNKDSKINCWSGDRNGPVLATYSVSKPVFGVPCEVVRSRPPESGSDMTLNPAQVEAIEVADANLNNADLPLYSATCNALNAARRASLAESGVVKVEVRSVYGNDTIYPANFEAERFAVIAGKKTLSRTDLMNIKALGFAVEEVAIKKLAA